MSIASTHDWAQALEYCLRHNRLYRKNVYQRSETTEGIAGGLHSVKPLNKVVQVRDEMSDAEADRIVMLLKQRFGMPIQVDPTRLQSIGIPPEKIGGDNVAAEGEVLAAAKPVVDDDGRGVEEGTSFHAPACRLARPKKGY